MTTNWSVTIPWPRVPVPMEYLYEAPNIETRTIKVQGYARLASFRAERPSRSCVGKLHATRHPCHAMCCSSGPCGHAHTGGPKPHEKFEWTASRRLLLPHCRDLRDMQKRGIVQALSKAWSVYVLATCRRECRNSPFTSRRTTRQVLRDLKKVK